MRIGVDACCWANKRGFGRFTRELLEELLRVDKTNEYLFFIDGQSDVADEFPARVKTIIARTDVSPMKAASSEGRRSIKDLWAMTREVLRHKIDVFFFPSVYSYFPIFNRAKVIVTVHDLIADHHPELIFPDSRSRLFWRMKQSAAIRQADVVATVSEYSKHQIMNHFRLPASRLRIISEAARPIFKVLPSNNGAMTALAKYGLKEKILLYVGGISPHKNLGTLIDAFAQIVTRPDQAELKLVLVGDYKDDPFFSAYPSLKKQISKLSLENKVVFTGFVSDNDLAYLYNSASALIFPSLEEGFGLPAIEAMSCGTPVVASETGSLPEVLGEAGCFFDPKDSQNMAEVILQVLSDESLQQQMKKTGIERAGQFLWKNAAEDTLRIFEEIVQPENSYAKAA